MTMFLSTRAGQIPLSRIVKCGQAENMERKSVTYEGGGGSVYETSCSLVQFQDFEEEVSRTVFPAHPGTYCLNTWLDGDQFTVSRSPVIAWALSGDIVQPITADGINDGVTSETFPILHPDGQVEEPGGDRWTTFGQWSEQAEIVARTVDANSRRPKHIVVAPRDGAFLVAVRDAGGRAVDGYEVQDGLSEAGAGVRAAELPMTADVPIVWVNEVGREIGTLPAGTTPSDQGQGAPEPVQGGRNVADVAADAARHPPEES